MPTLSILSSLKYQIVEPGNYFGVNDNTYQSGWNSIEMHDDGLDGDQVAGDDIYTAQVPASVQQHRRLIRYRILAADEVINDVTVPYDDDPQPNFAYFVYDGVPAWKGAVKPGAADATGQAVEYGPDVMQSLPVYHLISRKADVEACTWKEKYGGSEYKWSGTLVYDGEVYDHIALSRPRRRVALRDGQEHVEVRLQPRPRVPGARRLRPTRTTRSGTS